MKVMKTAKEIRSGDKKRVKTGVKTPINRRSGCVPGGSVVFRRLLSCWRMVWADGLGGGWRMLAFLGAGEARREGPPPGVVLSVASREAGRWSAGGGLLGGLLGGFWLSAGDGWAAAIRRRSAAAIRRYLISN